MDLSNLNEKQVKRERDSVAEGVRRYKAIAESITAAGNASSLGAARRLSRAWVGPMFAAIRAERSSVMRGRNGPGCAYYGPALMLIDADRSALITVTEILNAVMKDEIGCPVGTVAYRIGSAILAEAELDTLVEAGFSAKRAMDRKLRKITSCSIHAYAKQTMANPLFNRKVAIMLGARCLSIAMTVCLADYEKKRPAFEAASIKKKNKRVKCIRLTKHAMLLIDEAHSVRSMLRPKASPMIVEPKKWISGDGGYLTFATPIAGKITPEQDSVISFDKLTNQRLALDVAGSQPWKINATVLAVAAELWKSGANIPGVGNPDSIIIPKPTDANEATMREWRRHAASAMHAERIVASERAKFLRRLDSAKDLIGHVFYLPHRIDWRGRMHPIPTNLNHHQNDFSRGLLLFHGGGEPSWPWIRVHAANCWGHGNERKSFDQRSRFVENMWEMMVACGKDPLNNDMWHAADSPWQFLACCVAAHRGDIASCLPIQLDHSANALQHITALGLDAEGALLVNLTDVADPYDPYDVIVKRIHRKICEQAENGDEMATEALPFVVRSILKRPLMTTVYRVSRHGAANQVKSSLPSSVPLARKMALSRWISDQAIDVMHESFASGMKVIDWIEDAARACLKTNKHAVLRWTSPTGMPVVQPYRRFKRNVIRTAMQSITVVDTDSTAPCDRRRQMRGIFANYVQSIEAAQMHGMAMTCGENGIAFAGVHDSVWTTSNTAAELHMIARHHFAGMHMADPLSKLAEEWSVLYPSAAIPPLPARGTLHIPSITNATYMLS